MNARKRTKQIQYNRVSEVSNPLCRVTLFINVKPMELCFFTVKLIQFNVILG